MDYAQKIAELEARLAQLTTIPDTSSATPVSRPVPVAGTIDNSDKKPRVALKNLTPQEKQTVIEIFQNESGNKTTKILATSLKTGYSKFMVNKIVTAK